MNIKIPQRFSLKYYVVFQPHFRIPHLFADNELDVKLHVDPDHEFLPESYKFGVFPGHGVARRYMKQESYCQKYMLRRDRHYERNERTPLGPWDEVSDSLVKYEVHHGPYMAQSEADIRRQANKVIPIRLTVWTDVWVFEQHEIMRSRKDQINFFYGLYHRFGDDKFVSPLDDHTNKHCLDWMTKPNPQYTLNKNNAFAK